MSDGYSEANNGTYWSQKEQPSMTPPNPSKMPYVLLVIFIVAAAFLLGREFLKPETRSAITMQADPVARSAPVASAAPVLHEDIADAGRPETTQPTWETVKAADYPSLVGKWVGEDSDAIAGGKLVVGGARVEIVAGREGSKTPFNISFVVPRKGDDSKTAGGGCGFYESGEAYCKGYGMELGDAPHRMSTVTFQRIGLRLRVTVSGLFTVDLLQDGEPCEE